MTKKHFIALADAVMNHNKWNSNQFTNEQLTTLADFCASQNPDFKRDRWIAYINGTCGPNGGSKKFNKLAIA